MRNEINIWENATTTQLHDHLTENNFNLTNETKGTSKLTALLYFATFLFSYHLSIMLAGATFVVLGLLPAYATGQLDKETKLISLNPDLSNVDDIHRRKQ